MRKIIVLLKNILSIPIKVIRHISILSIIQDSEIDKNAAISSGTKFYRSKIGKYSYIGNNSFITDTYIGNFTSISANCYIGGTTHPINWVSTSSVFHKWPNILHKNFSYFDFDIFSKTFIGNDVWIGSNVIIKAGVKIGNGAIIGMGSVVTKDVGDYEIWAGNPAKIIRKRFSQEKIQLLNESSWWNLEDNEIEKISNSFNDVDKFIETLKKERKY